MYEFIAASNVIPSGHRGVWSRWSSSTSTTGLTETPVTKTNLDLSEFLAKDDQGDFLRSVAEAVLQLIAEADAEGLIGARRHERSGARTALGNGCLPHPLTDEAQAVPTE